MVDANQRWDLPAATRAAEAFDGLGLAWLEEPLRAEDLAGHVALRERTTVPIAVGENLHTVHRFAEYLDAGGADIVQPNLVRVGGITPFLRIARLAEERGAPLHPHLLPELSAQVALALGPESLIEDVEDAGFAELGALDGPCPVRIDRGAVTSAGLPGLGLLFTTPPDITTPPAAAGTHAEEAP
jgi:L-alanine-DL-glutamate epimerase-like enolase superfamily enzyme